MLPPHFYFMRNSPYFMYEEGRNQIRYELLLQYIKLLIRLWC